MYKRHFETKTKKEWPEYKDIDIDVHRYIMGGGKTDIRQDSDRELLGGSEEVVIKTGKEGGKE